MTTIPVYLALTSVCVLSFARVYFAEVADVPDPYDGKHTIFDKVPGPILTHMIDAMQKNPNLAHTLMDFADKMPKYQKTLAMLKENYGLYVVGSLLVHSTHSVEEIVIGLKKQDIDSGGIIPLLEDWLVFYYAQPHDINTEEGVVSDGLDQETDGTEENIRGDL